MRCKPGDLAILIKPMLPENLGMIVTVLHLSEGVDDEWVCSCPPGNCIDKETNEIHYDDSGFTCIDDWQLQPIRGSEVKQIETEEVV